MHKHNYRKLPGTESDRSQEVEKAIVSQDAVVWVSELLVDLDYRLLLSGRL
jgi:hypothetical protein